MTKEDIAIIIANALKQEKSVTNVVLFMAKKSVHCRTKDGKMYNIGIAETTIPINVKKASD